MPQTRATLRSRRGEQRPGQPGQVVPLMAVAVVLVAALSLGVAGIGRQVVDRARAQSAADSAALAAAVAPPPLVARDVAQRFAARNGAVLTGWRTVRSTVVVTVEVGGQHATAAARPVTRGPPRSS